VVYEWDPTTGLARLRYERTIAGMVEHEFDQVHHGRCYVPANVRSRL
jgi:hypothetical protein